MKKFILTTIIAVLITAVVTVGSAGSVSVAANTKDAEVKESRSRYWTKESFTTNNRKGVIEDGTDNLYATIITLKIPPKESSKSSEDISGSGTDSADRG